MSDPDRDQRLLDAISRVIRRLSRLSGGPDEGPAMTATQRLVLFETLEAEPIRLSDLYPLLAQAYRDNYTWLRDFEDDQLLVSNDLYEVVRAFSNCRPSA